MQALHISPNDPKIQAHLALAFIELNPAEHPRAHRQAEFFSLRATSQAPDDEFVRDARAEVLKRIQGADSSRGE